HEVRTPLTLVSGPIDHFIETYAKSLPQNQISWLHKASQNSHRLNRMVKEIFDLSKLEDQKLETDLKPLNIRNAINQNVAFFDSAAHLKAQQLSVSIGDELPEVVMMDREKLETILNNLISNALKFTPFQGSVTVTASWQNNMLSILVSDTGRGISADDLPHIFERYFQTNNTNMPLEGGAGIGLALSRELAQLMKGDLTAESTQPNGSVFSLTLPAIPTKADPVQYPTPPTKADTSAITSQTSVNNLTTQTNATILLVEDNLDMQAYIHELLQDQYAIFTATNGEHALHLLEKMDQLPDAIISDLMMPGMDGFTLLNHLKKDDRYAWIPTVMLTARSDARDKLQALTIGVDDYITKPFSAHELRIRINNLITKRKEALKYNSSSANNPEQQNEQLKPPSARDLKWLQSAEQALLSAIDQPNFTNSDLAKELALSERQVARKIKQITGLSPKKYFREIRLQYAREMLEKGEVATVNEAAFAVGFDTPSYFSRLFEERFGRRPSDFL
ncbi:MAG: response regulator, partial [Saprospiraceae bacterium]|nr:response regulator [Saprospiraceae bacterium]